MLLYQLSGRLLHKKLSYCRDPRDALYQKTKEGITDGYLPSHKALPLGQY